MDSYAACFLAAVNFIAFAIAGFDKRAAKRSERRVSEKSLFLLALAGGAIGLYLAMFIFHHKTRHGIFKFGIPALIIVQVFVFLYLQMCR